MSTIRSRALLLRQSNIDTDQIIPARFLTTVTRSGLGRHLFADWRLRRDGSPHAGSPLAHGTDTAIIVAGSNFGCGSSREHAVWALRDAGVSAVISTGIADIFKSNALNNGIAPVELDGADHARLCGLLEHTPHVLVSIDLERQEVHCAAHSFAFSIEPFGRRCLIASTDPLGWLLRFTKEITEYEESIPCRR